MRRKETECKQRLEIAGFVDFEYGSDEATGGKGLYSDFAKWAKDNDTAIKKALEEAEERLARHREQVMRLDPLETQMNKQMYRLEECDAALKKQIKEVNSSQVLGRRNEKNLSETKGALEKHIKASKIDFDSKMAENHNKMTSFQEKIGSLTKRLAAIEHQLNEDEESEEEHSEAGDEVRDAGQDAQDNKGEEEQDDDEAQDKLTEKSKSKSHQELKEDVLSKSEGQLEDIGPDKEKTAVDAEKDVELEELEVDVSKKDGTFENPVSQINKDDIDKKEDLD